MESVTPVVLLAWTPPVRMWLAVVCLLCIGLTSMAALNVASNVLNRILLPSLSDGAVGVGLVLSYMLLAILTIEAALLVIKVLGAAISEVALSDDLWSEPSGSNDSESGVTQAAPRNTPFKAASAVGFLTILLASVSLSVLVSFQSAAALAGHGPADRVATGAAAGIDTFLVSSTLLTLFAVILLVALRSTVLITGQVIWLIYARGDTLRWDSTAWVPLALLPTWARVTPVVDTRGRSAAMASVITHAKQYTGWYSAAWVVLAFWRDPSETADQSKTTLTSPNNTATFALAAMVLITLGGVASVGASFVLGTPTVSAWLQDLRRQVAMQRVERLLRDGVRLATVAVLTGFPDAAVSDFTAVDVSVIGPSSTGALRPHRTGLASEYTCDTPSSSSKAPMPSASSAASLASFRSLPLSEALGQAAALIAASAARIRPEMIMPTAQRSGGNVYRLLSSGLSFSSRYHGVFMILATAMLAAPAVLLHNWCAGGFMVAMLVFLTGSWLAPSPREGFCTGACRLLLAVCVAALAATSIFATESHGEGPYSVLLEPPSADAMAAAVEHAYASCAGKINGLSLVEHCLLAASAYGTDSHIALDLEKWFVQAPARSSELAPGATWVRTKTSGSGSQSAGPAYFALHNNASSALHIVVRGTASAADWGEDMDLWQETALWQLLGLVGPYGSWPLSTQQALIRAISMIGSLVGGISLHHDDPSSDAEEGGATLASMEGGPYHADLLRFIKRERSRLPPGTTVSISGHSLGGGLATIVGRELGINAVSFAGPGVSLTGVKLGFSKSANDAYGRSLAILPDHDIVSRVDEHTGTVQHVRCRGATGAVACHSITRLCCELIATCGDALGRSLRQCPAFDP